MKFILRSSILLSLTFLLVSCLFAQEQRVYNQSTSFVITGDLSSVYTNGTIKIMDANRPSKAEVMKAIQNMAPDAIPEKTDQNYDSKKAAPQFPTAENKEAPNSGNAAADLYEIQLANREKMRAQAAAGQAKAEQIKATNAAALSITSSVEVPIKEEGVIAQGEIENGQFSITGNILQPIIAYIEIKAEDINGQTAEPVKGMSFVLESGELVMTLGKMRHHFSITGGDKSYNEQIYSYKHDDKYKEHLNQYASIFESFDQLSEQEKRIQWQEATKLQKLMVEIELQKRFEAATSIKDKQALFLLLDSGWTGGPWIAEAEKSLIDLSLEDERVRAMATKLFKQMNTLESKTKIDVGSDVQYFYSHDLDGNMVSLYDHVKKKNNRYLLLEFWASWCGPCRAEIPNLKEAYTAYNDKGFEIFSFTIDDNKAAWQKASEAENFDWIDAGMGTKTGPKAMYQIKTIPANFLIDTATDKIVGVNLKGEELMEKLKELID